MGIGTQSPTSLLDVNGTITAKGLSVPGAELSMAELPDAQTAPAGADLCALVVDTATGKPYMQ